MRQEFLINDVAKGRTWIEFSGSRPQVEAAFHTSIHEFAVGGQIHHANAVEVSFPRSLSKLANGVVSLNDFHSPPPSHTLDWSRSGSSPLHTDPISLLLSIVPADFWIIYNELPLLNAGITGNGVGIAIAGRTDINLNDVRSFRLLYGLPANDPVIIHNGPAPGDLGGDEELEANIDIQWSGAIAPEATVGLVVSGSTNTTGGELLSALYAVNNSLAPILSFSFGICEARLGVAGNALIGSLWSQAAAQGISVVVASGDSGAAACDPSTQPLAVGGPAVSGSCSTPFNVCVGGTEFPSSTNTSAYWSGTNDPTFKSSALAYIPEIAWNESGLVPGGQDLRATGGGRSIVYAKPSWQASLGVPNDGARDTPDLSLSAAGSHVGYRLFLRGSDNGHFFGTSIAAPAFAGIIALVLQKTGVAQGNPNPVLYRLGRNQFAGLGPSVFHDITAGFNDVPGQPGYSCTPGYDLVTGLGSVDATALANNWPTSVPPMAGFNFTPANPIAGGAVSFDDISSGSPSSWSWNFGDPTSGGLNTSSLQNPSHTFERAGTYTVTLTASNAGGSSQVARAVNVSAEQVPCSRCTRVLPFRSPR
jgi:subtilase family serine protease